MNEIFLSASVPVKGRGDFYQDADPYLIQIAVRELLIAVLGKRHLVFGGHPAITPMIVSFCAELGLDIAESVVLYQSRYFHGQYPEENAVFKNCVYVDAVSGDREGNLLQMRSAMLSRPNLTAAVFIGGMEGVLAEYQLFRQFHPEGTVLALEAPGGAAGQLARELATSGNGMAVAQGMDFARLFYQRLGIDPKLGRKP